MRKKNGFTLVELLAVIVVLALIMVLAIPSVLDVMGQARKKSFVLYLQQTVIDVQTQFTYDSNEGPIKGRGWYVYNIETDLNKTSTGGYHGFVTVDATDMENPHYIVEMWDNNYMINHYDVTSNRMPTVDSVYIFKYDKEKVPGTPLAACRAAASNASVSCHSRTGDLLSD